MKINYIILHCSDSDNPKHDNIETIRDWHLDRGFKDIGYQYLITKNGGIFIGRKEFESGAHCKGFNKESIGICLTGRDNFSNQQFDSLSLLVENLCYRYNLDYSKVLPHNHFNKAKTCPNFPMGRLTNLL